jgi:hypothetical protein
MTSEGFAEDFTTPRGLMVRAVLEGLRDRARDTELRTELDDVLSGRATARDLMFSPVFAPVLAEAGRRLREEIEKTSPDELCEDD